METVLPLTLCSKALSAVEKSSSFSLLRPPYSTGRRSGAMNLRELIRMATLISDK